MMDKKGRRIVLGVSSALVVVLIGGVALAAILFSKSVPSSVNVVNASYEIALWSGATSPLDSITWGDMAPNAQQTQDVWVQNIGNRNLKVTMTHDLPATVGTLIQNGSQWAKTLSPGEIKEYMLELTLLGNAPDGLANFTVTFNSVND